MLQKKIWNKDPLDAWAYHPEMTVKVSHGEDDSSNEEVETPVALLPLSLHLLNQDNLGEVVTDVSFTLAPKYL
jgi:hypothetical protein